jgi:regulator of PEP synthase PpsR (kinase-PPPase family)
MSTETFHIHLVSDATGETINNVARAGLAQFESVDFEEHYWSLIRSKRQLDLVKEALRQWPGLVFYTFVDKKLRDDLNDFCRTYDIPCLAILEPVISALSAYFGTAPLSDPGRQHALDADYFARIEAMDYALSSDDGKKTDNLEDADVIILGVSRTSKTPTSIYLSHRGIRAANIPLVPGVPINVDLTKLEKPLIVGLTKDPESLVEIRLARLKIQNHWETNEYVDIEKVREEVRDARRFFSKLDCPVIDVSRKSIEETAGDIMTLLSKRALMKKIEHDAK